MTLLTKYTKGVGIPFNYNGQLTTIKAYNHTTVYNADELQKHIDNKHNVMWSHFGDQSIKKKYLELNKPKDAKIEWDDKFVFTTFNLLDNKQIKEIAKKVLDKHGMLIFPNTLDKYNHIIEGKYNVKAWRIIDGRIMLEIF